MLHAQVVGLEDLAARADSADIVLALNRVFSCFDSLADKYGVHKVGVSCLTGTPKCDVRHMGERGKGVHRVLARLLPRTSPRSSLRSLCSTSLLTSLSAVQVVLCRTCPISACFGHGADVWICWWAAWPRSHDGRSQLIELDLIWTDLI